MELSTLTKSAEALQALGDAAILSAHEKAHAVPGELSADALAAHHLLKLEAVRRGLTANCDLSTPVIIDKERMTIADYVNKATDLPMSLIASLREAVQGGSTLLEVMTLLSDAGYELAVNPVPANDEATDDGDLDEILEPTTDVDVPNGDINCPDCAGGCSCGETCSCWNGCACSDCEDDEEEDDEDENPLADLFDAIADLLSVKKGYSFAYENAMIARNKKRKGATDPHDFVASKYATRKGKVRCMTCGGGQPADGVQCNASVSAPRIIVKNDGQVALALDSAIDPATQTGNGSDAINVNVTNTDGTVSKADTYTPPQGVQEEAKRALEWIKDGKAGSNFTAVGRTRAVQLANGKAVSLDTIKRMHSFLSRHSVDSEGQGYNPGDKGYPSAGRVAYAAWGGKAALGWVKEILDSVDKAKDKPHAFKESADLSSVCADCNRAEKHWTHAVAKAQLVNKATTDEERYTLAPVYIPDTQDAHGEWTDANELQHALWDYVRAGDRRIRLQHNRDVVAGEWVELMTFPFALSAPMLSADGKETTMDFPANTAFMGIIWEPWAWSLVKSGKLSGLSIGGKAQRVDADLPEPEVEKDGPTVDSVHVDAPIGASPRKPKKPKGTVAY